MTIMFVRLKAYDPRHGYVLRRYTFRGIKFQEDRGWYRVEQEVADYLREVHQITTNSHSPLAFDVCTETEAKAMDKEEQEAENKRRSATDNIRLSRPRDGRPDASDEADGNRASDKAAGDKGNAGKKQHKK